MASISLKNIFKVYPGDVTAVKDFNLEIEDKEFIILVGPSGCGKSTTLRMAATDQLKISVQFCQCGNKFLYPLYIWQGHIEFAHKAPSLFAASFKVYPRQKGTGPTTNSFLS